MAHKQQREFCEKMRDRFPQHFQNKKVLDIGSLNVNGTNKYLFTNCEYQGLDLMEGDNVDIVSNAKDYDCPDNYYDTIISTEVFEHDMYYPETIQNIMRILKPGGCFIFTCASGEREEHGTLRTSEELAPFLKFQKEEWQNYYKNLNENDIKSINNFNKIFKYKYFEYGEQDGKIVDLYFFGIKKDEKLEKIIIDGFDFGVIQSVEEMSDLVYFLNGRDINNFMEIGTNQGGTFKILSELFPNANKISLDLPYYAFASSANDFDVEIRNDALSKYKNVYLIEGDSHSLESQNKIKNIINNVGKLDFLFIDGDHSYEGVKMDYLMYSIFVKTNGLITFHDIKDTALGRSVNCLVFKLWEELKGDKIEFKDDIYHFGIGVLRYE